MTGPFFSSVGLDEHKWATLTDILDRFEQAWRADSCPDLASFVPAENGELQLCVLFELVRVDQEYRWRTRAEKPLEAYIQQWPQLRDDPDIITELLTSECFTRCFEDVPPTEDEIFARFPHIARRIDLVKVAEEACEDGIDGGPTLAPAMQSTIVNGSPRHFPCGQSFGRYRIDSLLGTGSMGVVYRAYDPNLERDVALKIPQWSDSRLIDRFVQEARLAARIRHPNICPVFDVDQIDGVHYITMALIDGPTLAEHLETHESTVDEAVELVHKIALALQPVHAQNIVHRDLKPSNIMLDHDGQPLLMDFGLARATEIDSSLGTASGSAHSCAVDSSASESLIGTPAYMSPEQVRRQPIDQRSDVYSLGILFYRLLTGKLPFRGTVEHVLQNILDVSPTRPRELRGTIPEQLESICLKAMAKDADDRYQTAGELANALDHYHHPASHKRVKGGLAVLATLVLGAAATLLYFKTGSGTLELDVPPGTVVVIDGKSTRAGFDHLEIRLAVGRHQLEATWEGASISAGIVTVRWRGDRAKRVITLPLGRIAMGWHRDGYDLGRSYHYPFSSNPRTSNNLEQVRWHPEKERGSIDHVRTADLDGNGTIEIVARIGDNVVVYDNAGKELWWRQPTVDAQLAIPRGYHGATAGIELVDLDHDGTLEVVTLASALGPDKWIHSSPIRALAYRSDGTDVTLTTIFEDVVEANGNPQCCFDFNADGLIDIVLAVAAYQHPHAVCVYDTATHKRLFMESFADQPCVAGIGDVNGDGKPELFLLQEWDSHVDEPVGDYDADHCYAVLFDLAGKRLWKQTYTTSLDGCLADLDGDGVLDIILIHRSSDESGQPGALHILNPDTGTPRLSYRGLGRRFYRHWSIADINNDGHKEVILGDGTNVQIIDANATPIHQVPLPETRVLATNDLNGDGFIEVIAYHDFQLLVLDHELHEIARHDFAGEVRDVIVTDIDNDGTNELLVLAGAAGNVRLEVLHFAPLSKSDVSFTLPENVASVFLEQLRSRGLPAALTHVRDGDRETVRKKLEQSGVPALAPTPSMRVIRHESGRASVVADGPQKIELDMYFDRGRWWVHTVTF